MGWGKSAHTAYNPQKQESQAGGGKLTVVCRGRKPLNRKRPCAKRSAFRMAELFLFSLRTMTMAADQMNNRQDE